MNTTHSCRVLFAILHTRGEKMRIDRLIGILSVLLQKEMITAPQLAEKFEVSRRTINRDIEELCKAGIPVCTRQGQNGGISIMDNYKMDRTLMTSKEMQAILAGLRSLDSVSGHHQYGQLMEKLQAGSSDFMSGNQSILIDLSSWYKDTLAPKISMLQGAIDGGSLVEFDYYSPGGESHRRVEPYYLIFRWSSWYVWGFCRERKDFRLFKLNRMDQVSVKEQHCEDRYVPVPELSGERIFPEGIEVKALFMPECKWRLIEDFGMNCFEEQPDGKLLFRFKHTDKDSLISWLMTFGDRVVLLHPREIQDEIRNILKNMQTNYEEGKMEEWNTSN